MPVFSSTLLFTCSPASALPRNPCSGEKMVVTLSPSSSIRSRVCLSCLGPTTPVWLLSSAMRLPLSKGRYSLVRSAPTTTISGGMAVEHVSSLVVTCALQLKTLTKSKINNSFKCFMIDVISNNKDNDFLENSHNNG